ncbi:MAG: hypothetical protein ACT4PM_12650 [Gemmatimonadales bacterium]
MKTRILFLLVLGVAACERETPTGPSGRPPQERPAVPGWLNLELASPNSDDGGILFRVFGGPIDSLQTGFRGFHTAGDQGWKVLLTGPLTNGIIARIRVPDINRVEGYRSEIQQIARRRSYAPQGLDGYQLRIVKP